MRTLTSIPATDASLRETFLLHGKSFDAMRRRQRRWPSAARLHGALRRGHRAGTGDRRLQPEQDGTGMG